MHTLNVSGAYAAIAPCTGTNVCVVFLDEKTHHHPLVKPSTIEIISLVLDRGVTLQQVGSSGDERRWGSFRSGGAYVTLRNLKTCFDLLCLSAHCCT